MPDADRHRLLFGPYRTPVFKYGDVVICESRGQVEIVGLSGGRIPWPVGSVVVIERLASPATWPRGTTPRPHSEHGYFSQ